jgi:hypothetical protein
VNDDLSKGRPAVDHSEDTIKQVHSNKSYWTETFFTVYKKLYAIHALISGNLETTYYKRKIH